MALCSDRLDTHPIESSMTCTHLPDFVKTARDPGKVCTQRRVRSLAEEDSTPELSKRLLDRLAAYAINTGLLIGLLVKHRELAPVHPRESQPYEGDKPLTDWAISTSFNLR
ncbi:hypothetical protein NUW54_g13346 [Trametes sanguinea]|uniref:Uncharacterized protein n=1 Tax=Trametes sanguinea TaxID=158606 RepID=A0ACC1MN86_9APHY|nr:hypothetical protein NUW54_g13346 [Trametes sanguinea]